jgi:hypothetical protein
LALWKQSRLRTALLLSPIAATVFMTVLHQYPWSSFQLLLFLSFNLSVLFAAGVGELVRSLRTLNRHAWIVPIGTVAILLINSAVQPIKGLQAHDYFKTTALLPLVSAIRAEPGSHRIFVPLSDGIICRFYKSVTDDKFDDVGIGESSFLATPGEVSAFSRDFVHFANGQECWVLSNKVFWSPMTEALFLAEIKEDLSLSDRRELKGYVGLKFRPAFP